MHSGLVAGKPRGNISFGRTDAGPSSTTPTTTPAPRTGFRPGVFGPSGLGGCRVFARASKKTSLPVVEGSPVKPGEGAEKNVAEEAVNEEGASLIEQAVRREVQSSEAVNSQVGPSNSAEPSGATTGAGEASTTTPLQASSSAVPLKRDNSRRASLALRLMRDQIAQPSATTQTPQTPTASGSSSTPTDTQEGASTGAAPLKRPPSSYRFNLRERPEPKSAPAALTRSGSGSHVAGKGKGKRNSGGDGEGTPERMRGVLRECTVFVDVRTDDGDDAGALFVDMLVDMGAKVRRIHAYVRGRC